MTKDQMIAAFHDFCSRELPVGYPEPTVTLANDHETHRLAVHLSWDFREYLEGPALEADDVERALTIDDCAVDISDFLRNACHAVDYGGNPCNVGKRLAQHLDRLGWISEVDADDDDDDDGYQPSSLSEHIKLTIIDEPQAGRLSFGTPILLSGDSLPARCTLEPDILTATGATLDKWARDYYDLQREPMGDGTFLFRKPGEPDEDFRTRLCIDYVERDIRVAMKRLLDSTGGKIPYTDEGFKAVEDALRKTLKENPIVLSVENVSHASRTRETEKIHDYGSTQVKYPTTVMPGDVFDPPLRRVASGPCYVCSRPPGAHPAHDCDRHRSGHE